MPENEENFSSHAIGNEKPKRRRVVKKISAPRRETIKKDKKIQIEKELMSIYEDPNGKIPDMREIKRRKKHPVVKGLFYLLFIGGIMAAAAWAGFFYLPGKNIGNDEQLTLEIAGPSEVTVGATTTYVIRYANNDNVILDNAILTVSYPDGFVYAESNVKPDNAGATEWLLGNIKPNAGGEIKITGQNYGDVNQSKSWRLFVSYRPENMQSELQKVTTLTTKITESPFGVAIAGPDKFIIGDEAKYEFRVVRKTGWMPDKLRLKPVFPINFYLSSTSPSLGKDNTWTVQPSSASSSTDIAEYIFSAIGKFIDTGSTSTEIGPAPISAVLELPFGPDNRVYSIGSAELKTELAKSSQTFSLAINGTMANFSAKPGDALNVTLYLKNTGKENLKNVMIMLALEAPALKKQSALNWGAIDDKLDGTIIGEQVSDNVRRGIISWTSRQLTALSEIKPEQEVSIDFRLPVRTTDSFDLSTAGEYLIKAIPELSYKDKNGTEKTLNGNPITITLNSDLALEVRSSGDEEKRDLQWILTNNFHALKNIELSATIFGDVSFATESPAPAGKVEYDSGNKVINWKIDEMPESVDVLALPFSLTVEKANPTQNTLVSKVRVKALDTITGQTIEFMGDEVSVKIE